MTKQILPGEIKYRSGLYYTIEFRQHVPNTFFFAPRVNKCNKSY